MKPGVYLGLAMLYYAIAAFTLVMLIVGKGDVLNVFVLVVTALVGTIQLNQYLDKR